MLAHHLIVFVCAGDLLIDTVESVPDNGGPAAGAALFASTEARWQPWMAHAAELDEVCAASAAAAPSSMHERSARTRRLCAVRCVPV